MGDGTVCMYANSAQGDIRPSSVSGPSEFAKAEAYGRNFAVQAVDVAKKIKTNKKAQLQYDFYILEFPDRTPPKTLLDSASPEYGLTPDNIQHLINALAPEKSYMSTLHLGELFAVSIPGEMTTTLGTEIKEAMRESGA
jgi:hypothetical protein